MSIILKHPINMGALIFSRLPNFLAAAHTTMILSLLPQIQNKVVTLLTLRRKPESKQPMFTSFPEFYKRHSSPSANCVQSTLWKSSTTVASQTQRLTPEHKVLSAEKGPEWQRWQNPQADSLVKNTKTAQSTWGITTENSPTGRHNLCVVSFFCSEQRKDEGQTQTVFTHRQWWQCDAGETHWWRANNQSWGVGGGLGVWGREGKIKQETQPQNLPPTRFSLSCLVAIPLSFSFYGSSKPIEGSELPEQQPITVIFVFED